jgi:hypothetical protein
MTLTEYLALRRPKPAFKPMPHYNVEFKCVEWYWSNERAYEEPIHVEDKWVGCVMRSVSPPHEAVGVKVFLDFTINQVKESP